MTLHQIPDRRSYSDRSALICAKLSSWSYLDFKTEAATLKQHLDDEGLMLLGTVSEEKTLKSLKPVGLIDTQAILVEHTQSGTIFVCYRGSEPKDLTDWYTDAQIRLKDIEPGIELHEGFLEAYQLVEEQIRGWLEEHAGKPIYTCGHSLGGALATVTIILNRDISFASCYTFGGPRVGTVDAARIKTPVYRVTNALDPVPDIPPATFFISEYRHLGDEYRLEDGQLVPEIISGDDILDQISENLMEAGSFFKNLFRSKLQVGIADAIKAKIGAHSAKLYVARLTIIAEARNRGMLI